MEYKLYQNSKNIKTVIIMFHGYGSNMDDLLSIAPYINCNDSVIVSLQAPQKCDIGFGYQWFGNVFDGNNARYNGCLNVNQTVEYMVNEIKEKFNVTNKQIILCGFSQGGMVCLHHGLQKEEKYKGLIILSSMFVTNDEFNNKIISGDKILICHGDMDDIIPIMNAEESYKNLNKNNVEYHKFTNIGHGIDDRVINTINEFITKI